MRFAALLADLLPLRWRAPAWLRGRDRLQFAPLGGQHAAAMARLHAQGFARSWDAPEIARMVTDPAVLADGLFLGDANQPAAFVLSRVAADEAEVLTICVDAGERGRGLAALLLARHRANLALRGVDRLFLEVERGNEPALRLYRKAGFQEVGARPGYYLKPDGSRAEAIVMRLDL